MKTSTILKKALKVLEGDGSNPAWTKGCYARNGYRHEVAPTNPNAVKFCAYGALHRALNEPASTDYTYASRSPEFRVAEEYLKLETPKISYSWNYGLLSNQPIDEFNDDEETSFEDVRKLYKRAIKRAKANND